MSGYIPTRGPSLADTYAKRSRLIELDQAAVNAFVFLRVEDAPDRPKKVRGPKGACNGLGANAQGKAALAGAQSGSALLNATVVLLSQTVRASSMVHLRVYNYQPLLVLLYA